MSVLFEMLGGVLAEAFGPSGEDNSRGDGDVFLDGEGATSFEVADGTLTACGDGWEAGEVLDLDVFFTHPVGTWEDSQVGLTTTWDGADQTYLLSWVGECDRHGPCDARPDQFATYRFEVTHPEGVQVLCSGHVTAEPGRTTCDFPYAGGPTYSTFGFLAGPEWTATTLGGDWGGLTATLYGECRVKDGRMVDLNFDSYEIMRLVEMPRVETVLVPTHDFWGGVGEPTIAVVAPAWPDDCRAR